MTHGWKGAAFGMAGAILVLAAGTRAEVMGARPAHRAQTVNVQMIGDAKGNRFAPASITIHVGDVVTWTNVSGAHNVVFWSDSIPAGTQAGKTFRIRGKGGGSNGSLSDKTDLLVTVNVVVPQKLTKEARELLEQFAGVQPESPREHLGKATGSRG